jgi:hypothetical protein
MKQLHIISFNVPYPADYGGVIDVFHKIKALSELGVKIHLHCFVYGRKPAIELENLCETVCYYQRKMNPFGIFNKKPFIVQSRANKELLNNLLKDQYPILFEGLHTTFYLNNKSLQNRCLLVRTHNIEHEYYHYLSRTEKNVAKRLYLASESLKLKRYEAILRFASFILPISTADLAHVQQYGQVQLLPAFHSNYQINILDGLGDFILYHGNLSVSENVSAALYLIKFVFCKIEYPIIIAGKSPSPELLVEVAKYKNLSIISNPSDDEMEQLIAKAQINVLITFQPTGIKLKLLNALFRGRYCLVNTPMVCNTGLESLCEVADTPQELLDAINRFFFVPFNARMGQIEKRKAILMAGFTNKENAKKILSLI